MRNKYHVGYLDKDEQICLIDVWADSPAAAGLLVRVEADLTGGRVRATVLEPGQSGLLPGTAYPFRLDLLNEVHA